MVVRENQYLLAASTIRGKNLLAEGEPRKASPILFIDFRLFFSWRKLFALLEGRSTPIGSAD